MTQRSVLLIEEGGIGGVADYTSELAAALARGGWAVTVATARDHRYPVQAGVRVRGVFSYVRGRHRAGRLIRRMGMSKVVNGLAHLAACVPVMRMARRVEVVHLQGGEWPPLTLVQALLIRACARRFVWTPHNTFDRGGADYRRTRALTALAMDRVILHAESDRRALPGPAAARAVVIPHGEYGTLGQRGAGSAPGRRPPRAVCADDGELIVLLFGQLRPDKGIRDLLQAALDVPGIRIWLVGEDHGGLAAAEPLLADPRLGGRVQVSEGFVEMADAPAVFDAADVVALPYHRASASGVLMLAYGYARPVVAYPSGGLPEYVLPGTTGWLCAASEPQALAAALAEIRAGGREESRRRGVAARRLAEERYSWTVIADRTARLYDEVRELGQPGPPDAVGRGSGR